MGYLTFIDNQTNYYEEADDLPKAMQVTEQ